MGSFPVALLSERDCLDFNHERFPSVRSPRDLPETENFPRIVRRNSATDAGGNSKAVDAPMKSKPNWPEIREAYLAGEGSLRQLAKRFSVSLDTLEKRCAREGWRQEMAALCGKVAVVAAETAAAEGKRIGLTASKLVERTLLGAEDILNKLEQELSRQNLDPQAIRALVASWVDAIQIARRTHRLDDLPAQQPLVRIAVLNSMRLATPDEVRAAPAPALPVIDLSGDRGEGNEPE
jgi:hypothetical protein